MDVSIEGWRHCPLKGTPARIFDEEEHGPLKMLVCPNNIAAVLVSPGTEYRLIERREGKRIRQGVEFIVVDGCKASLPFDFVLKEAPEEGREEYVAIVQKL